MGTLLAAVALVALALIPLMPGRELPLALGAFHLVVGAAVASGLAGPLLGPP